MIIVTEQEAYRVRDVLKAEIAAAVAMGVRFNGDYGAQFRDGSWQPDVPSSGAPACTCAIGCLLVNRQPEKTPRDFSEVAAAARLLDVPIHWLHDVYMGVALAQDYDSPEQMAAIENHDPLAAEIAFDLRHFGDDLMATRAEEPTP